MSVTNERRHDLHNRLDEVLGREEATTMMDYLPPVGWADVATKNDLSTLAGDLRSEMRELRLDLTAQMHQMSAGLYKSQRDIVIAMIGSQLAVGGLLFAALQLAN